MLVIRLTRTGRKKRPHYRVVVAEKAKAVKGKFIEVLGHYDPLTKELVIDNERAKARLKEGALPSETAEFLLDKAGVITREPVPEDKRRPTRKPRKEEAAEKPAEAAADGAASTTAETGDAEAKTEEAPAEKPAEETDEKPAEEPKAKEAKPEEAKAEAPAEDKKPGTNETADTEAPADNKGE